jgi:hypothetical protein
MLELLFNIWVLNEALEFKYDPESKLMLELLLLIRVLKDALEFK